MTQENLSQELRSQGINPTHPRLAILEYMRTHLTHPTVDKVYTELLTLIPGLSRTTVYNTLHLYSEVGLVQMLTIDEKQTCFDVDVHPHGHFFCTKCGKIYDIPQAGMEETKNRGLRGFLVQEAHHYYKGICPLCQIKD